MRLRGLQNLTTGALALLGWCACAGEAGPRSALLITLDTTRADAVGAYGRFPGSTPNLDRLASEGILFENAYTVAPITLPAHASMLTGLIPPRHGVRVNAMNAVPASAFTLAEAAQEAGLQTAAFIAAVVLDEGFGLAQGFELYDTPTPELAPQSTHMAQRPASEIVGGALRWLERRDPTRGFLLWVHLFDPHSPYHPPPPYAERAPMKNPYLGEVAYTDAQLGRLLAYLDEAQLSASTAVLVIGDHGEGLGEHDELTHAAFCYDTTLRVPCIARLPGDERSGTRVSGVVSVVDVAPTLAAFLELRLGDDLDGRSLLHHDPPSKRGAYFETYYGYTSYGWSPLAGWVDAEGKYLHSARPEFFVTSSDPGELNDLYPEKLEGGVAAYRSAIERSLSRPALADDGERAGMDAALLERIRSLGYAASGGLVAELPHPLAPTARPAPRDRGSEQIELLRAMDLGGRGQIDEALVVLDGILAENPHNYEAVEHRTFCLMQSGRHAEAIAPLRAVLEEAPDRPNTLTYLGICLMITGRVEEAVEPLGQALAIQPDHLQALGAMGDALAYLGRTEESEEFLRRFRELQDR